MHFFFFECLIRLHQNRFARHTHVEKKDIKKTVRCTGSCNILRVYPDSVINTPPRSARGYSPRDHRSARGRFLSHTRSRAPTRSYRYTRVYYIHVYTIVIKGCTRSECVCVQMVCVRFNYGAEAIWCGGCCNGGGG